jgi:WD40 repeat protein
VDSIPDAGPPERLTLNRGKDATATFAPDGQTIWYAWERPDRVERDVCLGRLPVTGGSRTMELCQALASHHPDSVDWDTYPAPNPDGARLAWLRLSANPDQNADGSGGIFLARLDAFGDPSSFRRLTRLPYQFSPGSTQHYFNQVFGLQWADDSTVVCVGALVASFAPPFLPVDTFYTGLELATITLTGDTAVTGYIPGTDNASGFTFGPGGAVYFTRNGDSRIYRTTLAGGTVDTLFDFGPGPVGTNNYARDPVYVNGAVYAIVNGDVTYLPYPNFDINLQHDGGGELWRIDSTGATLVSNVYRWRRPAVSPDGGTLVIEGRDPVSEVTDLFLLRID